MLLGGPKDTIPYLWTKGLKALVPPNSFGPPTMVAVVVNLYNRHKLLYELTPDFILLWAVVEAEI